MRWPWQSRRPDADGAAVFDDGLDLVLNFDGELSPIQAKLKAHHPALSAGELDRVNAQCQSAVLAGQQLALTLTADGLTHDVEAAFTQRFQAAFPQASAANVARAYRHCVYYATKTQRTQPPAAG